MKLFYNPGMGQCALLAQNEKGKILVAAIERNEFVVAHDLSPSGSWIWGKYFKDIALAVKEFYSSR